MDNLLFGEPINFQTTEKIVALSQILKGPPLIIVGANQIGKSSMLKESASQFPNSQFILEMDRGGFLREEKKNQEFKTIDNILLSGVENLLRRKYEVARSTLVIISSSIDDATGKRLIFEDKGLPEDSKKRNFIIGMTLQHFLKLYADWKEYDLLSRFAILYVDRKMTEEENKRDAYERYFTVPEELKEIPLLEPTEVYSQNPRQHKTIQYITSGLVAIGHTDSVPIHFVTIDRNGNAKIEKIELTGLHSPTCIGTDTTRGMEQEDIASDLRWKDWYQSVMLNHPNLGINVQLPDLAK